MALIAFVYVRAEEDDIYDYSNFRPTPGTETNPLVNLDFYVCGVSAYRFNNPDLGNPPTFRHFVGYRAEYADGAIETDSVRITNYPADNGGYDIQFFGFNHEYLVSPGWDRYIDEETKTIYTNRLGVEGIYRAAPIYDNNPEEVELMLDALRNGKQRKGIGIAGNHPDIDDVSYFFPILYDEPTFVYTAQTRGYFGCLYVYDSTGAERGWIKIENAIHTNLVYMKEFNTMAREDTVKLLDWDISYKPLGNQYGYKESVKIDMHITLSYHDYTVKMQVSTLDHFVFPEN